MEKPCARCGVNPRNSTLKSYCIDCKRALHRESMERTGGKKPQEKCSRCYGPRGASRHASYCKECWRAYREERAAKPCARCGKDRSVTRDNLHAWCPTCTADARLEREYGMTRADFDELLARQSGQCAICYGQPDKRGWHVDHDHSTGEVRGILCGPCNNGLGHFRDSPYLMRNAIDYLEGPRLRVADRRRSA